MLKNILNLKGAQQLSKNEQQAINGGAPGNQTCIDQCFNGAPCPSGFCIHLFCNGDPTSPIYGICLSSDK